MTFYLKKYANSLNTEEQFKMKKQIILFLSLALLVVQASATNLRGQRSYWQCQASDSNHQVWQNVHSFKRKAINEAYSSCKKQSKSPTSCSTSFEGCTMVIKGRQIKSSWHCIALDNFGHSFEGDTFQARLDAIDGAKALCQKLSASPSSCYVRSLTCKNGAL